MGKVERKRTRSDKSRIVSSRGRKDHKSDNPPTGGYRLAPARSIQLYLFWFTDGEWIVPIENSQSNKRGTNKEA